MSLEECEPYARITQTGRWRYGIFIVTHEDCGLPAIGHDVVGSFWTMRRAERVARRFMHREVVRRQRQTSQVVVR